MLSSVWIQQRQRIPTTIFYIFYSSSLSDTRLFRKMHRRIKELRSSRYFKHNWFIRPSEGRRRRQENELGLTCTFNYCCQGVCFALLGKIKLNHPSYQTTSKEPREWAIKFNTSAMVQHLLRHKQKSNISFPSCAHLRDGRGQRNNMCLSVWCLSMRCAAHVGCWHVMDCSQHC